MYIFGSDRQRCINFNIMFFWLKFVMNNFFKRVEWMLPEFIILSASFCPCSKKYLDTNRLSNIKSMLSKEQKVAPNIIQKNDFMLDI